MAATKNIFSQGIYSSIPTGSNGDIYYATDTYQLYQKISGSWVLSANNTYVDGSGVIRGTSTGSGTTVANSQITISGGAILGIGSGSGTAVANSSISINANGTLSGAGSGAVTPSGINAINVNLSNAPAGILNSNVTLGTLGAGGFAYLSQITSANATTYITGAAIGTAQVGVLTAGNIGANTIDASKIAANTITAGQIASNTITASQIAANTITASQIAANTITASQIAANTITASQIAANTISSTNMAANSITAGNAAIANATVDTLKIAGNAVTVPIYTQLSSNFSTTSSLSNYTVLSASMDTGGQPVVVFYNFLSQDTNPSTTNSFYVYIAGVQVKAYSTIGDGSSSTFVGGNGVAYLASPGTGSFNIEFVISKSQSGGTYIAYTPATNVPGCYFYALGTKR